MAKPSIPVSEIEKMIEKIVAASLKRLLCSDKGKEQVVIKDEKAKVESERKEHVDDTCEYSSLCLPIKPFEHKGKTYPVLEIFADVIDMLAFEPKALDTKSEKEKEKELEEEGVEGPQVAKEEEKKEEEEEGQAA
ncbi:hypothetical protein JCGZ_18619 [Jatropha curcas]|uniref:Uncharacterized protein n=1 Tax=Jatropha curcas TaxID=180498 RepID=A0A067K1H4_JATCU|nr:hypothetical protein JCGZ_18619 [Jatropha curcas]